MVTLEPSGTEDLDIGELGTRELGPGDLARLRPYVVNLNGGEFSGDGVFQTTPADVDAIFDVHLPRFLATAQRLPAPLVIWAHGGLVDEKSGLQIAQNQVDWWLRNGAYPLHFVWESGLLDALQQAVGPAGARDLWDHTTDPLIENAVRPLGRLAWSAMKHSALLASQPQGGARYVAERLRDFCADHPGAITLHAVGHSAGSIFQAHFLGTARELGVPAFTSLQYLAPAIRVDAFEQLVLPRIPDYVETFTVYTMRRELERDDNCLGAYRKSLLYLVSRALEPARGTPILGLEDSIVADPALTALFGLPAGGGPASVIWSRSASGAPVGSRSTSTSHGGFDNDVNTMTSVASRIMAGSPVEPFPSRAAQGSREVYAAADPGPGQAAPVPPAPVLPADSVPVGAGGRGPRRTALCVGINDYPAPNRLGGCVADAEAWARVLEGQLGFEVVRLTDRAATFDAILGGLKDLVANARAGDVLAFQYAGHGTEVPDLDGDETSGSNGNRDEAMCPVDFAAGRFLVDDDLRAVIAEIPAGVTFTLFADCCHSGTIARVLADQPVGPNGGAGDDIRERYLPMTDDLARTYRDVRRGPGARSDRSALAAGRRDVAYPGAVFAACADWQVAYETNGHGDFTTRCMQVFAAGGLDGIDNSEFLARVLSAFGNAPRQLPELDQADVVGSQGFLQPVAASPVGGGAERGVAPSRRDGGSGAVRILRELATPSPPAG